MNFQSEWTDPDRETVLSHFDTVLNKVYLSKKSIYLAVFTLEELRHKQFAVPPELLSFYNFSQDHPNALTEAIFIYEAFRGIFRYFLNDSFSSIEEYKTFSAEILQEMSNTAEHLNRVALDVGISKVVGGFAGAAGGVLCIVGIALAPFTLGASTILTAVGVSVGVAGGVTSTGAAIAETVFEKVEKKTFMERLEKFMSASEVMHAFANEFVKKSVEANLFNETEAGKAFVRLSAKPDASAIDDSDKMSIQFKLLAKLGMEAEEAFAFQIGRQIMGHIPATVKAVNCITTAHRIRMGVTVVGLADEAVMMSTDMATSSGIAAAEIGSLGARSFAGALSAIGVLFGLADVVMGARKIYERSDLAKKLYECLDIVRDGDTCAIEIYHTLLDDNLLDDELLDDDLIDLEI